MGSFFFVLFMCANAGLGVAMAVATSHGAAVPLGWGCATFSCLLAVNQIISYHRNR